ncbi:MAG: hypothetical protein JWP06_1106 [Candidatus Saccharibacteria bacterium]|nr:hypothetical protein [Candidatus Saccharibacteria bacterium]
MKIKQTVNRCIISLGIILSIGAAAVPISANADCAGVKTSIISCTQKGGKNSTSKDSGIWGILLLVLNIMTAGVGIAAVGGIVYAAILYTTASDRAEQVKKAKDIIQNVAIGLAAYAGMYLLLNFLVPGGIFS